MKKLFSIIQSMGDRYFLSWVSHDSLDILCYLPKSFSTKKIIIEKRSPTGKIMKALLKFFNVSGVPSSAPSFLPTPMHRAAISACLFFFQYSISPNASAFKILKFKIKLVSFKCIYLYCIKTHSWLKVLVNLLPFVN